MFTGIIEAVGRVVSVEESAGRARLRVEAPGLAAELAPGESVAVSGACLSVAELAPPAVGFDAVPETLSRTALGELSAGSAVNLERALRADGRLDGHLVQGHVDATGRVRELRREGEDVRLFVDCEAGFAELLVEKGSVAIDGVSLTLVGVAERSFDVALIPHTLAVTTLGCLEPRRRVNLEADVLGKYVRRYLGRLFPTARRAEA